MSPNPLQHYSSCYLCGITNRSSGNVHIIFFIFTYVLHIQTSPVQSLTISVVAVENTEKGKVRRSFYCKWAPFQRGQSLYPTAAFSDFSKSSQSFSAKLHFTLSFYLHPLSFNKTLLLWDFTLFLQRVKVCVLCFHIVYQPDLTFLLFSSCWTELLSFKFLTSVWFVAYGSPISTQKMQRKP